MTRLSSLAQETFVFIRRETVPMFYDLVVAACREAGFVPHATHEADHPQLVLGLVTAGIGISLVPASTRGARTRGVVFRPLTPSCASWNRARRGIANANHVLSMHSPMRHGAPSPI